MVWIGGERGGIGGGGGSEGWGGGEFEPKKYLHWVGSLTFCGKNKQNFQNKVLRKG